MGTQTPAAQSCLARGGGGRLRGRRRAPVVIVAAGGGLLAGVPLQSLLPPPLDTAVVFSHSLSFPYLN